MYRYLTKESQNHPERFCFLTAPGRSEFWKNIETVARCIQSEGADKTIYQSTEPPLHLT